MHSENVQNPKPDNAGNPALLSVVVPAYNEALNIPALYDRL